MRFVRLALGICPAVALLAVVGAGLFGISITHGDQIAETGLLLIGSALGWTIVVLSAVTLGVSTFSARRRGFRWASAGFAVLSTVVVLIARRAGHSDARAINGSSDGAAEVRNPIADAVVGPIAEVEVNLSAVLLMAAAMFLALTAILGLVLLRLDGKTIAGVGSPPTS